MPLYSSLLHNNFLNSLLYAYLINVPNSILCTCEWIIPAFPVDCHTQQSCVALLILDEQVVAESATPRLAQTDRSGSTRKQSHGASAYPSREPVLLPSHCLGPFYYHVHLRHTVEWATGWKFVGTANLIPSILNPNQMQDQNVVETDSIVPNIIEPHQLW